MTYNDLYNLLLRYEAKTGVSPKRVARLASNNPRLLERMERRSHAMRADVNKILSFMFDNHAASLGAGLCEADRSSCLSVNTTDDCAVVKSVRQGSADREAAE